jgi:hypothetical protein
MMAFLYSASKKKPKKDEIGNIILQLPKLYAIIGLLLIIGGIGILIFAFITASGNDWIIAISCSLIPMILGVLLFAKGYISHIKITESGIIETTMLGKLKEIRWNEINDLSFGKVSLEMKIASSEKNIKAHIHLVGFDELVSKIEEKTGKTRIQIGIPE